MGEAVSLMEFVKLLLSQEAERAHFAADPDATLARHGLGELSPADVHDAVGFVEDTLTVDWAQAYGTGAGAAHPPTPEPGGAPGSQEWWAAATPDPVVEHDDPALPPAASAVDDALFDAPDLHFGH
ncbi:MAG TPA: IniB N-terminal domain-containing protein [Pseudonocardia sp.]|nr:IniB N-terminal domain-containing protein [Pseudonocardia sp.]